LNFLLDTNVVSEWTKARPDPGVVQWLDAADEDRVFVSVVTLAELRRGVTRLRDGTRRRLLEQWLGHEVIARFASRIIPVDDAIADCWGRIIADREASGRPMSVMDGLIAATAEYHDLTLVTRNSSDFDPLRNRLLNPWAK
jgi:predicted nucleic acid-binding protein